MRKKTRIYTKLSLFKTDERDAVNATAHWWSKRQRFLQERISEKQTNKIIILAPYAWKRCKKNIQAFSLQTRISSTLAIPNSGMAELLPTPVLKTLNTVHCMTSLRNLFQCFTRLTMRKLFLITIWNLPLCNQSPLFRILSTIGMEIKLSHSLLTCLRTVTFYFSHLSLQ